MAFQSLYNYVPSLPITLPDGFPQNPYTDKGYSANGIRLLLNNLLSAIPPPSDHSRPNNPYAYLEIGLFTGSTFFPAIWKNNHILTIGIDNWVGIENQKSNPDIQRKEFFANLLHYKTQHHIPNPRFIRIIDGDAFSQQTLNSISLLRQLSIDGVKIAEGRIKVFFYDGCHTAKAQELALLTYYPYLADEFVYVVDDWYNKAGVSKGTFSAFETLCNRDLTNPYCNVIESVIVPNTKPSNMPLKATWHCGIGVFRCKKIYKDDFCTNEVFGLQHT